MHYFLVAYSPPSKLQQAACHSHKLKERGYVPLGWSGSGSVIQNHLHHGTSNEPMGLQVDSSVLLMCYVLIDLRHTDPNQIIPMEAPRMFFGVHQNQIHVFFSKIGRTFFYSHFTLQINLSAWRKLGNYNLSTLHDLYTYVKLITPVYQYFKLHLMKQPKTEVGPHFSIHYTVTRSNRSLGECVRYVC